MDKKGILSLLAVGVLFGLSGPFAKYLSTWLNAYQVVALRFSVAFVIAVLMLIILRKQFALKKVNKTNLALFAVTFPASVIFFTLAVINSKVSLAVFTFYIANLLSSFVVGVLFFKEKMDTKKTIALVLVLLGLICFTNPFEGFVLSAGLVYGIISGVLQTLASTFQKTMSVDVDRLSLIITQTIAGLSMAVVAMIATNTLTIPTIPAEAIGVGVLFGAMFLAISYLMLYGFQRANLSVGTLLISSELVFGPVFAYLMFAELPAGLEVVGGLLTIIAVIVVNLPQKTSSSTKKR